MINLKEIIVTRSNLLLPNSKFNWKARIYSSTLVGYGATKGDAISDLLSKLNIDLDTKKE